MNNTVFTVSEYIERLADNAAENYVLYGDFLDAFYSADTFTKAAMIEHEPDHFDNVEPLVYVNIAATVHKLANDNGLLVPAWVFKKRYYADEPYFPVQNSNLRLIYMFESPTEFKHRNLFVSANTLSRV
jgi:hypothetical protein